MLLGWLLTGVTIVTPAERALSERLGVLESAVLEPGMHWTWPRPFGRVRRVPAARLASAPMSAGNDEGKSDTGKSERHEHAFRHVARNATELVVLDVVVTHRVRSTPAELRTYVVRHAAPDAVLAALAKRLVSQAVRRSTLDRLMTRDRRVWSEELRAALQRDADQSELGVDVAGLDIAGVHPPTETNQAFRDVENARIDAARMVEEARLGARNELIRVAMLADSSIADAQGAASVRRTEIANQVAMLETLAASHAASPVGLRRRLYCEALGEALRDREFTLVDGRLAADAQLWLDSQGAPRREAITP